MKNIQRVVLVVIALILQGCKSAEYIEQDYISVQTMNLRDDDRDGVINARDLCAQTPLTSTIDEWGCSEWDVDYKHQDFVFNFKFDKNEVLPEHQAIIKEVLKLTLKNKNSRILLVGDTSPEGSDKYNEALGKRRAEALIYEMVKNGIPRERIVGFTWNQDVMKGVLKKRERRTIVRAVYRIETSVDRWNIFTTEDEHKEIL